MTKSHKQLTAFLRDFLLTEWDPIGVQQEPEAQDEYDSYIQPLVHLLADNASSEKIATYFHYIETHEMGLTSDKIKLLKIAQKLKLLLPL